MGEQRAAKWYFGGMASCGAACFTHPLDLLKVHLQTQQVAQLSGGQMALKIVKNQGFLALYNGLSASLLRQLTYSTTRFAIYEVKEMRISGKEIVNTHNLIMHDSLTVGIKNLPESVMKQKMADSSNNVPFYKRVALAGFAGACGGFVGTPGDMINVRMQNDIKLPADQKRNYKHALDGIVRVVREEGVPRLFRGASTATFRAVLMTIGQLSFYDQIKGFLLTTPYFNDNLICHFTCSLAAGAIATTMTQPVDVIKTRAMNAGPGEFRGLWHIITYTGKMGPSGFFKGYVPAFVRLGPHTIITFIFFEQLRKNFGILKPPAA